MSHPNQLVIIGAIVDKQYLHLYKEDGTTYLIPQGDPRLQRCLDVAMANLKKLGDKTVVDVSEENHFANYEEKSGGLVRLFRVAKAKVAEFFGKTEAPPVEPITLGIIPSAKDVPAMTATVTKRMPVDPDTGKPVDKLVSAVADIMQHAVPVSSPEFVAPKIAMNEEEDKETEHTMIAVVDGQVIPNVEALASQFAQSAQDNTVGMAAFLKRLAAVMGKRRHSVEDLMKFMKRGDLPVADDGSIVIYKILKKHRTLADTFVDCHTENVPQKVGSYVHMDENMVDPNRRNECSNGLHVARRGYLGGFSGDVCVLAKVAPEDVIAVPDYDANKMRVCGYHILFVLSNEAFTKLRSNRPMTDNSADQALLGRALSGDHVGILEKVKINGQQGQDVVITPVGAVSRTVVEEKKPTRLAQALPDNGTVAKPVDVKEVAKAATKAKEELYQAPPAGMNIKSEPIGEATPPPSLAVAKEVEQRIIEAEQHALAVQANKEAKPVKKLSLKETALAMYSVVIQSPNLASKQAHAANLILFKKEKKKSWADLGFTPEVVTVLENIGKAALPQKGAIFTNEATIAKAEAKVSKPRSDKGSKVSAVVADDVAAGFPKKKPHNDDHMVKAGGPREQLAKLLKQPPTTALADQIVAIKKKAKKSWDALGVTPSEVSVILELASK